MKKIILGVFLLMSALSFAAERKVQVEQVFKNANTGIVYVQGEETPYTGLIEVKFPNGKTQALTSYRNGVVHGKPSGKVRTEENYKKLTSYRNGVVHGKGITYHPNGKVWSKENYKNGVEDGVNIIYYENGNIEYEKNVSNNGRTVYEKYYFSSGKLDFEATYQDGKLNGVVKKYGENGQVVQQGTFKNGVQVQ